ncbi:MAG: hypothetical protein ACI9HK_000117 [Pirellulaceae bacterium]|jgi:hypothetical protein
MPRIKFFFPDGMQLEMTADAGWRERNGKREFLAVPTVADEVDGIPIIPGMPMSPEPRVLCVNLDTGEILSDPRDRLDEMSQELLDFMEQTPDWPLPQLADELEQIRQQVDLGTGR